MVSLERYAELRAAIEQGGDRDAVLRANRIAKAEWIQIQRRWLDALAAEIDAGGTALAARYCGAFEAARPKAEPVEARPGEPSKAEEPAAKAQEPPAEPISQAPVDPPVQQVPSFMKAPELAARPARKPSTLLGAEPPRTPSLPFNEGAQSELATPAPRASEAPRGLPTGTALSLNLPRAAATPFQGDAAQPASSVPVASVPVAASAQKPSTPAAGASTAFAPSVPVAQATPFHALEPEAMGFNLARYAELVAARGDKGAVLADVLAQFGIDAAAHDRIEAFWRRKFSENGMLSLQFGTQLGSAKKALAERRGPRPAHPGTGTALAVDPPKAATPFTAPAARVPVAAPSALPDLTVEQYAWLAATLRRTPPDQLESVLSRFRLTPQTRKELEERWSKRMADEPALQQTFLAALARHISGSGA